MSFILPLDISAQWRVEVMSNNFSCEMNTYVKIHSFLKQCLRNLHFFKIRYFSRNLSISCSIQVPCFDKLKIVHNTVLKMKGDCTRTKRNWIFGLPMKKGRCIRQTCVQRHDEISTIYTFFNQWNHSFYISADLLSCDYLKEVNVHGRNFVVPSYARTPELRNELKWSRLTTFTTRLDF